MEVIGDIIKNRKISLNEASRRIGIAVSHLSYIIKGKTQPSPQTVIDIIKGLSMNKEEALKIIDAFVKNYPTKTKEFEICIFSDIALIELIFGHVITGLDTFPKNANLPKDILKMFGYNYDGSTFSPSLFGYYPFGHFGFIQQSNFFTQEVINFLMKIDFPVFNIVNGMLIADKESVIKAEKVLYTFDEMLHRLNGLLSLIVADIEAKEINSTRYDIVHQLLYVMSKSVISGNRHLKEALNLIVDFYENFDK